MLDIRQSPQYAKHMLDLGWKVERIKKTYCYIKKIPILGNVIKIQRPETPPDAGYIKKLQGKFKPFQIIIEPSNPITATTAHSQLLTIGFKKSKSPYLPTKTIQIDLTQSLAKLLSQMHHKTRYNISLSQKRNFLEVKKSKDIESFAEFWDKTARERGIILSSQKKGISSLYKSFGKNSHIFLALHEYKLVGGLLIIISNKVSYYMYAGATKEGKKLFAPTILAWKAIKFSKEKGVKLFDFEGIYDERFPLKSWKGFTRFKKSFGGKEVEYPGCFVKTNIGNIITRLFCKTVCIHSFGKECFLNR